MDWQSFFAGLESYTRAMGLPATVVVLLIVTLWKGLDVWKAKIEHSAKIRIDAGRGDPGET